VLVESRIRIHGISQTAHRKTELKADSLRAQRDAEIAAEGYSGGFGIELLQETYSTPVRAVPKPRSEKLRLVFNRGAAGAVSAGTGSLTIP
jgi:hypothetical protein